MTSPLVPTSERVGRDGHLRLRFEQRGATTVLARCRCALPLQVLTPLDLPDRAAVVSMLNPTGGLLGGDRLSIDVEVGEGAHACLTTPSATRVYRTVRAPAEQHIRLQVEGRATLEWVPDHVIPHAGAAMRQRIDVELGRGARLILVDAFAAGRIARGEAWRFALLESALSVRDDRGWLLHDRFVLDEGGDWHGLAAAEARPYFATVLMIGAGHWAAFRRGAAEILDGPSGVTGAVGALAREGVMLRLLAWSAPSILDALDALWAVARRTLLGLPPLALRKL